jgi:hypothetical protein
MSKEKLVNFYQTTRRYNPEDSHLRTHRREKLKSYILHFTCQFNQYCAHVLPYRAGCFKLYYPRLLFHKYLVPSSGISSAICTEAFCGFHSFHRVNAEVKIKSKAVPLHAMMAHGGRGGIASTHT